MILGRLIVERLARVLPRWGSAGPGRYLAGVVREALEEPGCPICRLAAERELRSLEAILYEQVTDPVTHRRLLAARGFCFEHGWALAIASERVHSRHGLGIIHLRLLRDFLRAAERGVEGARRWLRPLAPCPICVERQGMTASFTSTLARLYAADPGLARDLPALLCRPHGSVLLQHLDPARAARVGPTLAERWRAATAGARGEPASPARSVVYGERPALLPEPAQCPACLTAHERAAALTGPRCRLHGWTATPEDASGDRPAVAAAACPLCAAARAATTLSSMPGTDLCLGHLRLTLERPGAEPATVLRQATAGLQRLTRDLQRFGASADYRFTGTLTEAERRSWRAAVGRLQGETPGVDLHAVQAGQAGQAEQAREAGGWPPARPPR